MMAVIREDSSRRDAQGTDTAIMARFSSPRKCKCGVLARRPQAKRRRRGSPGGKDCSGDNEKLKGRATQTP